MLILKLKKKKILIAAFTPARIAMKNVGDVHSTF